MKKYRCTACDYIYDPTMGDPENGIPAGTPFEELPEDWACPICGLGKDVFEIEESNYPFNECQRPIIDRWHFYFMVNSYL